MAFWDAWENGRNIQGIRGIFRELAWDMGYSDPPVELGPGTHESYNLSTLGTRASKDHREWKMRNEEKREEKIEILL